jgi:hypothetical protein
MLTELVDHLPGGAGLLPSTLSLGYTSECNEPVGRRLAPQDELFRVLGEAKGEGSREYS